MIHYLSGTGVRGEKRAVVSGDLLLEIQVALRPASEKPQTLFKECTKSGSFIQLISLSLSPLLSSSFLSSPLLHL